MTTKTIAPQKSRHPYLTLFVAMLSMVGPFTIDTYLPSFPAIEAEFGISRAMLSQSLGVYLAAFAISTLFWGPLSDRIGRRLVTLASLLLYTLASIGCALADNGHTFMLMRIAQGLAASGGFIAGRAMIRDIYPPQAAQKVMSHVMLVFAAAPAIAPVLGGWLHEQFGWRSVFWFLSIWGGALALLMLFTHETLGEDKRQSFHPVSVLRVYGKTLMKGRFMALVFSLAFGFGGLFLYIAGAPTLMYDFLGMGANDFGLQFIPMVGGMMLGAFVSGRLSHRWAMRKTVTIGFAIMLLATLLNLAISLLAQPVTPLTGIGPLVVYTFGLALSMPALGVMVLDCLPKNRGTASSIQGFVQMMTNALVASTVVPLLHTKHWHFAAGQGVFLLLALGLWWGIRGFSQHAAL